MKHWRCFIVMASLLAATTMSFAGEASAIPKQITDQPDNTSTRKLTVDVDDVGKYLKEADSPRRKGKVKFTATGPLKVKDGGKWIEAMYFYSYNGFRIGYVFTGKLKVDKPDKNALEVGDLENVEIRYTDSLLEAKRLTAKDVPGLIERLYEKANKVECYGTLIPGGEILGFSDPMEKLMILGEKARKPLLKRLGDKQIRNEAALILGAIGDEATVPALIAVYPDVDIMEKKKLENEDYLNIVCMTFALTYLTGQQIGRDRTGADFNPENQKLWKLWWEKEKATFKIPIIKPNDSWMPIYPIFSEEWAKRSRERFVKGD
jgi:hypothetical protein